MSSDHGRTRASAGARAKKKNSVAAAAGGRTLGKETRRQRTGGQKKRSRTERQRTTGQENIDQGNGILVVQHVGELGPENAPSLAGRVKNKRHGSNTAKEHQARDSAKERKAKKRKSKKRKAKERAAKKRTAKKPKTKRDLVDDDDDLDQLFFSDESFEDLMSDGRMDQDGDEPVATAAAKPIVRYGFGWTAGQFKEKWSDALDKWTLPLQPKTRVKYSRTIRFFGEFLMTHHGNLTKFKHIKLSMLQEFCAALQRREDVTHSTIRMHVVIVKSFMTALYKHRFIKFNPAMALKLPHKAMRVRDISYYSEEDVQVVLNALNAQGVPWDCIGGLMYYGGVRAEECVTFTIHVDDPQQSWFKLERGPEKRILLHVIGKGNKLREVPITGPGVKKLWRPLKNLQKAAKQRHRCIEGDLGYVFNGDCEGHRGYNSVYKKIHGLRRQLPERFSRFAPHDFRRAFATHLSERGLEIGRISRWLGHSDIKTTEKYIQYDNGGAELGNDAPNATAFDFYMQAKTAKYRGKYPEATPAELRDILKQKFEQMSEQRRQKYVDKVE